MSAPKPRSTRGSRVSSPFVSAPEASKSAAENGADQGDKKQTLMTRWTEPQLAPARPSFVEAGHVRHSSVMGMNPLGTLPSAKLLKALAKPDGEGRGTPMTKSASNNSASTPGITTPEPPSNPPRERSTSVADKPEDTVEVEEAAVDTEMEDVVETESDAAPKTPLQPMSGRKSFSRPSVPPQSAGLNVFALGSPMPSVAPLEEPRSVPGYRRELSYTPEPTLGPDGLPIINLRMTDNVVETAVNNALDDKKWPTAYALRTIYDEHRTNPRMVRIFEAVYNDWATEEQHVEFHHLMRQKKREGKKHNTGEEYFYGDGPDSLYPRSPVIAQPVLPVQPFISAINLVNPSPPVYRTPYAPRPSTAVTDTPPVRSSSVAQSSVSVSASPLPDHEHINKKQRSNSFQPVSTSVDLPDLEYTNGTMKTESPAPESMPEPAREPVPEPQTEPKLVPALDPTPSPEPQIEEPQPAATSDPVVAEVSRASTPRLAQRSRSVSSSSSLSSVNEDLIANDTVSPVRPVVMAPAATVAPPLRSYFSAVGFLGASSAAPPRFVSPYANADTFSEAARSARNSQARPISAPAPKEPKAPKTFTFQTVASPPVLGPASSANISSSTKTTKPAPSSALANNHPSSSDSSMAPTALAPASSNSSTTSTTKFPPTFRLKNVNKVQGTPYDENDAGSRLKRKAKAITADTSKEESFERHQVQPPEPPAADEVGSASDGGDSIAVATKTKKTKKKKPQVRLLNKSRETRQSSTRYESDGSSPTQLSFEPMFAPGESVPSSRAGTPSSFNRPPRKQKAGSGLRLKTSPMKKKNGTSAGIPKDMRSPTTNGGPVTQDGENDDFCSACGGNGDLVCCDGCTRSFHFRCVDPPILDGPHHPLPDEWFCNLCHSKQRGGRSDQGPPGLFGHLLSVFEEKNPSAFHLPKPIREHFEDVKTGPEGEYEEIVPVKPKNRNGYEEAPDYFRKKDAKGKIILCHHCHGEASAPSRMIIPCSYCNLNWHLDCLPVPLAKEPGPGRSWRCPAHIDDLLVLLPDSLAPAHRFRKLKKQSIVKPSVSRGIRNNGYIEIENEVSEDEEEQGFFELREFGHVYKLPAQGIKLDFISKIKSQGGGYFPSLYSSRPPPPTAIPKHVPGGHKPWNQRSMEEQQAAMNIAALAFDQSQSLTLETLTNTLVTQAPPAVVAMMAQGDAHGIAKGKIGKAEKQAMLAMFEILKKKLVEADVDEEDTSPAPPVAPATEVAAALADDTANAIPSPVTTPNDEDAKEEVYDEDDDTEMLL